MCIGTVVEFVQYNATAAKTWRVVVYTSQNPGGVTVAKRTFSLRRGDYFWGFGPGAGELASRMKENGRMWLLLPKDLQLSAASQSATRGASPASEAECLVPDPELCVE